jgi:ferritin-like metal-binding protein YciE
MAELNERDTKLVQFLNEAHAKEKELETALQLHIGMTTKKPYKKRLQEHLRETKDHSRQIERRLKKIGGGDLIKSLEKTAATAVGKARATVKGQVDAVRGAAPIGGPNEAEQMLKNARQQYTEEAQEIATYKTIIAFAEKVGDKETVQLAKGILRDEERMAKFLDRQIQTLTNGVVTASVPASQRPTRRRSTRRRSASRSRSSASRSRSASRSTRSRSRSSSRASGGARKRTSGSSGGSRRRTTGSSRSRRS